MFGLPAGVLVGIGALLTLLVGSVALRTGMRTLTNRHLNPEGGMDNLAVTLIGIGIGLIGWGVAGPVLWFTR